MRWVLITAFGAPVEPEVNRNFTMVSGPVRAKAASTASVGCIAASSAKDVVRRLGSGLRAAAISIPAGTAASIARANAAPSLAKTRPGVSSATICRSFSKSVETSE